MYQGKGKTRTYAPDATVLIPTQPNILRYQKFHKLPRTGVLDNRTLRHFGKTNTRVPRRYGPGQDSDRLI